MELYDRASGSTGLSKATQEVARQGAAGKPFETVVKVWLRLVPIVVPEKTMSIAMSDASKAYSIEVAPVSSLEKQRMELVITHAYV